VIRVGVETATARGSVAVARGGRLLAEVTLGVQTRHAEHALPALDAALSLAGVARSEIEAVVVGEGPGSFTGVRVAGATGRGLAAGLDVPLLAAPSLLALAAAVPSPGPVCALFDARRGEVYAGCWRIEPGGIRTVLEPAVGAVDDILAALPSDPPPLFVGSGAVRYRDALVAARVMDEGAFAGVPSEPRASTLLWLAERHPGALRPAPAGWEPRYVRSSGAERGVRG
jgi:tRNA threonylcarbamoyladenosine biosynthesis protein TsaB